MNSLLQNKGKTCDKEGEDRLFDKYFGFSCHYTGCLKILCQRGAVYELQNNKKSYFKICVRKKKTCSMMCPFAQLYLMKKYKVFKNNCTHFRDVFLTPKQENLLIGRGGPVLRFSHLPNLNLFGFLSQKTIQGV